MYACMYVCVYIYIYIYTYNAHMPTHRYVLPGGHLPGPVEEPALRPDAGGRGPHGHQAGEALLEPRGPGPQPRFVHIHQLV